MTELNDDTDNRLWYEFDDDRLITEQCDELPWTSCIGVIRAMGTQEETGMPLATHFYIFFLRYNATDEYKLIIAIPYYGFENGIYSKRKTSNGWQEWQILT